MLPSELIEQLEITTSLPTPASLHHFSPTLTFTPKQDYDYKTAQTFVKTQSLLHEEQLSNLHLQSSSLHTLPGRDLKSTALQEAHPEKLGICENSLSLSIFFYYH